MRRGNQERAPAVRAACTCHRSDPTFLLTSLPLPPPMPQIVHAPPPTSDCLPRAPPMQSAVYCVRASLPATISSVTDKVQPSTPIIALHRTPLPTSSPRSITTCRATQPRRLAPYPFVFRFNYLSKGFLGLFPPFSDKRR